MSSPERAGAAFNTLDIVMKETDPAIIVQQIAMGLELSGNRAAGFLNNFETALPGGFQRDMADMAGLHDAPFVQDNSLGLHGNRALIVSNRQFFEDVDRAASGTDIEGRLVVLRSTYAIRGGSDREVLREKISRAAIPAYIILRQLGYWHYDLCR